MFVAIDFADDFEDWQLHRQLIYITRCGPDDSGMRAGAWAFVAFATVFTPILLLSAGRVRRDIFSERP
jgi:hypothetical protein